MSASKLIVEKWISVVSTLLDPARPGNAVEPLRLMAVFMRGFAPVAFTEETARLVVEAPRYGKPVPAWDVIAPILRTAVQEAKAFRAPALAPPAPEPERGPRSIDDLLRVRQHVAEANAVAVAAEADFNLPPTRRLRSAALDGEALAMARRKAAGIPEPERQRV